MPVTIQNGKISLASEANAYVVDLVDGTYARAAKVLPIGDSLTHGFDGPLDSYTPAQLAALDGYRGHLFDAILSQGGWIDYVGRLKTGPSDMLDPDHAGTPGEQLREMVGNGLSQHSDLSNNLRDFSPDITLLMGGTNDFNNQTGSAFVSTFNSILSSMEQALGQFLSYAGSSNKYLLVSTLPPKIKGTIPEESAYMLNEGYSVVGGKLVVGNAGNGTYRPGIVALVEEYRAEDSRIVLVENPVTTRELDADGVHFEERGFQMYANALFNALRSKVGLVDGTFVNGSSSTQGSRDVDGSAAGDRITGNGSSNTIAGNGGADYITLGGGADVVVFGAAALDGKRDVVTDLNPGQGDWIDLGGLASALNLSMNALMSKLSFSQSSSGTQMSVTVNGSAVPLALFNGLTEAQVRAAIGSAPVGDPPSFTSADAFEFIQRSGSADFLATATDPDNDPVTFSLSGKDAAQFDIEPDTGRVSLVGPPHFGVNNADIDSVDDVVGIVSIVLTASDGRNETQQNVTITYFKDSDGDTIPDIEDNAILVSNADQADSNGDGRGDVLAPDIDGNGSVDAEDFAILAAAFNSQDGDSRFDMRADLNYDGRVSALDFSVLSMHFNSDLPQLSYLDLAGL